MLYQSMRVGLEAPEPQTLSRGSQVLRVAGQAIPANGAVHLIADSTGLSVVSGGEWVSAKDGQRGRRGWKKPHLGVDAAGVIVAHAPTDASVDDATVGIDLLGAAVGDIASVTILGLAFALVVRMAGATRRAWPAAS